MMVGLIGTKKTFLCSLRWLKPTEEPLNLFHCTERAFLTKKPKTLKLTVRHFGIIISR